MTEKEYRAQKAIGTIDYQKAAVKTNSKKVLASIVEDTDDQDIHLLVAMNTSTDVRTLTRLIIDRNTDALVINTCVWHPSVTLLVLETWMKRDYMRDLQTCRERLYALQAAAGIPISERIELIQFTTGYHQFTDILRKGVDGEFIGKTDDNWIPRIYTATAVPDITYDSRPNNAMKTVDNTTSYDPCGVSTYSFSDSTNMYDDIEWMVNTKGDIHFDTEDDE